MIVSKFNFFFFIIMNRILQITSALFLAPVYLCESSTLYSDSLFILLFMTFAFSQMFWSDPNKQSAIHVVDSLIAKITFFSFVIYTFYIGCADTNYIVTLSIISVFFGLSHYFSRRSWCSPNHIVCHGFAHLFCAYAITFAFIS
jgi:hypothetical protein